MKKLLPVLLAVLILLAGCGKQTADPTGTEPKPTQPTEQAKPLQAVQTYSLEQANYCDLRAMGNRLLLVGDDGTLSVVQETTGAVTAQVTAENPNLHLNPLHLDVSTQGVAYYVPATHEVVLLNPQLQENDRIALPETIQGDPVIHLAANEVYYCLPGQILAMDLQSGISRMVRSHGYANQQLLGMFFEGKMLCCRFTAIDGSIEIFYISGENGQTLYEGDGGIHTLYTGADGYFAGRLDGVAHQWLVGSLEEKCKAFLPQEQKYASALPMGGVVGYNSGADTILRYYDLESGVCTSQATLSGTADPIAFQVAQNVVWVLTHAGEQQALCRWDVSKTLIEETESCLAERTTLDNPNEAGLAECVERAEQMSQTYHIKIAVWQDALAVTGGHEAAAEYQVSTVNQMLDSLEAVLQQFPEGFLKKTLTSGDIYVNLVRTVNGDSSFQHFWLDGNCHMLIGCRENAGEAFLYGFGFALDSHILGNSRKLDNWNKLNPKGFDYSYENASRADAEQYLGGEDPAFLEERAMYFPTNDRSSVFCYAMSPKGADVFASETMQAKLVSLCKGIREAYGLEKSEQTYPWEQYLAESLIYVKK